MLTINDISVRTGLKITFIRKCLKLLSSFLEPHVQRGNFNSILFSSSAMVIFDKIAQLKQDGLSLPEIQKQMEGTVQSPKSLDIKPIKTAVQSGTNIETVPYQVMEQMFDLERQLREEKERRLQEREESTRRIHELELAKERLMSAFKLLPEGKTPEQIKSDWERQQEKKREVAELIGQLKSMSPWRFLARKKLLVRLEELQELRGGETQ